MLALLLLIGVVARYAGHPSGTGGVTVKGTTPLPPVAEESGAPREPVSSEAFASSSLESEASEGVTSPPGSAPDLSERGQRPQLDGSQKVNTDPRPLESPSGVETRQAGTGALSQPAAHGVRLSVADGAGHQGDANPGEQSAGKRIDLNSADAKELEQLPGIGPVLAERILQWRLQHQGFSRVEDLMLVRGIGEKRLNKIRPHVTLGP